MTGAAVVLLLVATGAATAGAIAILGPGPDAMEEAGARRAIRGLEFLAVAVAVAVVAGAVLGAGGTAAVEIGAYAGAAATFVLPVIVVAWVRRSGRVRTRRRRS